MNEEVPRPLYSRVYSYFKSVNRFQIYCALACFVAISLIGFSLVISSRLSVRIEKNNWNAQSTSQNGNVSDRLEIDESTLTYFSPPTDQDYSYCLGEAEKTYSTDGTNVYLHFFEPRILMGADPKTFKILSLGFYPCGSLVDAVAKDVNHVYVWDQAIDADVQTFKLLGTGGNGVYQDIHGVYQEYCKGDTIGGNLNKCEDIDSESFVRLANDYYADKNGVYIFSYSPKKMAGLKGNLRAIDDRYMRDDVHVYYYEGTIIEGADPNTFHTIRDPKIRNELFAADSKYVYWGRSRVPELDPSQLVIVSNNYVKDDDTVYYVSYIEPDNIGVIKGADVDTFEIVDAQWEEARDKFRAYKHGVPVQ